MLNLGLLPKPNGLSEPDALEVCRELYAHRERFWGAPDSTLDLTDIQFQLCEFDKYLRVANNEGKRPKAKFVPHVAE